MSTPSTSGSASRRSVPPSLVPGEAVPLAWTIYSRQLERMPSLSVEREWELADGIAAADEEALEELVHGSLRYALGVARRYLHFGLDLEDLVQEANVGLLTAARKFATERRFDRLHFKQFAFWWIRYHVVRAVEQQGRAVRLPKRTHRAIGRLGRARRKLAQTLQRQPTVAELAEATELEPAEVELMLAWARSEVSLDAPAGASGAQPVPRGGPAGMECGAETSDPAHRVRGQAARAEAERVLAKLKPRQALVLRLYFGLKGGREHTLGEIGERLGLSRESARLIRNRALDEARRLVGAPEPNEPLDTRGRRIA